MEAVYKVDDRMPNNNVSENGLNDPFALRSTPIAQLATSRAIEELQEATRDANGKCLNAQLVPKTSETSAFGLTNSVTTRFSHFPVKHFHKHVICTFFLRP
ncbi:hypothetical protein QN277_009614 [Acacia crassicarpa]|nr:hypothetical protein QN277_009614 [Acacia crassicarpa]